MPVPALFRLLPVLALTAATASGTEESDFYRITTFATPPETALEVGSIELLPDGRLAVGTRRGEVWLVRGAERYAARYR